MAILYVGLALTAFGLAVAVLRRAPGLAIVGGLFAGWGVVGGIAATRSRSGIGALVCAALFFAGLLLLGVLPLPAWGQRAVAAIRRMGIGLLPMGVGLVIIAAGLGGGASEGVPAFMPVAAGLAFFFAGVLSSLHTSGGGDSVASRTLGALLMTSFAAATVLFPPSLLFMAPIAVLSWIAVGRLVIEKRTGRDPLAGWSDGQVLGLGCGVTLVIALLIIGLLALRSCRQQPREHPPAEAVGQPTGLE